MSQLPELSPDEAARAGQTARTVIDELDKVILGQRRVLEEMVTALLAGGHALLEGVPGTAKTLAIRVLALLVDQRFARIQFTPDLMPTDITGVNVLNEIERRFDFHSGPVFHDIVLADEINRAPAKTQAALLEAMQERQVTVDGATHALPEGFTVFASQNPIEHEGTYPLPEAQLDRFLLKIAVGYPSEEAEVGILTRYADGFDAGEPDSFPIARVLGRVELSALRAAVRRVRVEPDVRVYIVALVRRTRQEPTLSLGASPRAAVALFRASQARAILEGRDFVTPDDVKSIAPAALRHRVALTAESEVEGATADDRIALVLQTVQTPGARG